MAKRRRIHQRRRWTRLALLLAGAVAIALAAGYGGHPWWRVGPGVYNQPSLLIGNLHHHPNEFHYPHHRYYYHGPLYPGHYYSPSPYGGYGFADSDSIVIINNTVNVDASNGGFVNDVNVFHTPGTDSGVFLH